MGAGVGVTRPHRRYLVAAPVT